MQMADMQKNEKSVDLDTVSGCLTDGLGQNKPLKTQMASLPEEQGDGPLQTEPGLLSMPCLLLESQTDSPESQPTSTESVKLLSSGQTYESDSSNQCMPSPTSSGHMADSDTLSSGEEDASTQSVALGTAEEDTPTLQAPDQTATGVRKSRRIRSESEPSSTTAMAAKKNRWQPNKGERQPNGRHTKAIVHWSQKQKDRMRSLRQKREAAARKKHSLLQDSSTSDSDMTCDSSSGSSDDVEEASGSRETFIAGRPAGLSRTEGSVGGAGQTPGLVGSSASWDRNGLGSVLEEAMTRFAVMQRRTEERFRVWMELTQLHSDKESSNHSSDPRDPKWHEQRAPRPPTPNSLLPSSEPREHTEPCVNHLQNVNTELIPLNNNPSQLDSQNGNLSAQETKLNQYEKSILD
ncbi:hypothetical protein MATL_G00066740 [Megalops atlanticus]|uniref:E3 ubiquitin-protein ligase Arkadia N-terminal domain-containing protein n=1 Tax=Megalops atlanticus TaxID=7932 RepID=A0A9D3QDI4_MEGAT|nr:hypothetical protein MATL_G00066740 [Megalops atlanticus]